MTNLSLRCGALVATCALFIGSTACSTSTVLATLNSVVVAADTAVGVLAAANKVPASTAEAVEGYLNAVATASDNTATELGSGDTNAVKSTKIAEIWATATINNVAELPATVAVSVDAVSAAVNTFLGQMGVTPAAAVTFGAHTIAPSISSPAIANQVVKPSLHERFTLAGIRAHAKKIEAATKTAKK